MEFLPSHWRNKQSTTLQGQFSIRLICSETSRVYSSWEKQTLLRPGLFFPIFSHIFSIFSYFQILRVCCQKARGRYSFPPTLRRLWIFSVFIRDFFIQYWSQFTASKGNIGKWGMEQEAERKQGPTVHRSEMIDK